MPRHKNAIRSVEWVVKHTLVPGVDDDLIALKGSLERGTQSLSIKRLMRLALEQQPGQTAGQGDPIDNTLDLELALDGLIG